MKYGFRKLIKTLVAASLLLAPFSLVKVAASEAGPEELTSGSAWRFRVFLDDKEIGYHNFFVAEHDGMKQLKSVANFEYKLLFVRLFHYEHENSEIWTGDCLQSINSRTDANGEPFRVDGRREVGEFLVDSSKGETSLPECVMSFAYWNPKFLGESRPSYRYRLAAGALNLDLWYSTDRDWLALESEVQGGRTLRYERM
jgi:hypothetical protein